MKVHKIFHLSDIHIRCNSRHEEFNYIFIKFLDDLKKEKENSIVVITGNLLYNKNKITPEEIILARDFLYKISKIFPLFIILGKNDKESNINAVIYNIDKQNIYLIEKGHHFKFNNLNLFNIDENKINTSLQPELLNIGLFHGVVGKCQGYLGKKFINKSLKIDHFSHFDLVLLGGIHKTQFLTCNNKMGYAGSLIQQNYNENWSDHGYILWDLKSRKGEHRNIMNQDYRHIKIIISDGELMTPIDDVPKNVYVKWELRGTTIESLQNIKERLKLNILDEKISFLDDISHSQIEGKNKDSFIFDLSLEKQLFYANKWISDTQNNINTTTILDKEEIDILEDYIKTFNSQIKNNSENYTKWKLINLEFQNVFCYGNDEKQIINFDKMTGINGIVASNNAGKSAIFDILVFSIFGKSTRTDTYSYRNLINNKKDKMYCKVSFQNIDTKDIYSIRRDVTTKNMISTISKNHSLMNLKSNREINTFINSILGTYDDFLTITFLAQNNTNSFLSIGKKLQKEFILRIFKIGIYEKFHKLAKTELSTIKNLLNNKLDFKPELLLTKTKHKEELIQKIKDDEEKEKKIKSEIKNIRNELLNQNIIPNHLSSIHLESSIKELEYKIKENEKFLSKENFKENNKEHKKIYDLEFYEEEITSLWNKINNICIELKKNRGKKIKQTDTINIKFNKSFQPKVLYSHITKNINFVKEFLKKSYDENICPDKIYHVGILEKKIETLQNNKEVIEYSFEYESLKKKYTKDLKSVLEEKTSLSSTKLTDKEINSLSILSKSTTDIINKKTYQIDVINNLKEKVLKKRLVIEKIDFKLKQVEETKNKLKTHKYNPDCKFCCQNPFVIEKRNIISRFSEFKDELEKENKKYKKLCISLQLEENKLSEIKELEKKLELIQLKNEITELRKAILFEDNKIKKEEKNKRIENQINETLLNIKKYKKELKKKLLVEPVKNDLDKLINFYNHFTEIIKKYEEKKNINIKNKKFNDCITIKNENIKLIDLLEKNKNNNKILENQNKLKHHLNNFENKLEILRNINISTKTELIHTKNELEELIKKEKLMKEINKKLKIIQLIVKMTHTSGIPSLLIKKVYNLIESNVNFILSKFTFKDNLEIKIKDINKDFSIISKNGVNTKMLCGSEKFLVELAFRVCFQKISNISKPNFFICDEGWSCLDDESRSKLDIILKTILQYNKFILTVSHIDDVRHWMNKSIKININESQERKIIQQ